jgi:hypothetical protein
MTKKNVWIAIFLLLTVAIVHECRKKNKVLKNGKITIAKITGIVPSGRWGPSTNYEYRVSGILVNGSSTLYKIKEPNKTRFIGHYFPLIYLEDLSQSYILITKRDFDYYQISFPDSLKWTVKYID